MQRKCNIKRWLVSKMTNLIVKLLSGFQIIVNWKGDATLTTSSYLIQTLFNQSFLASCAHRTLPPPPHSRPSPLCPCDVKTAHDKATKVIIECFHMTSRRPYWCPKTMKRRPYWCPKPDLWELNSFLVQAFSFVPINLHRCWPREWKRSIPAIVTYGVNLGELETNKRKQVCW